MLYFPETLSRVRSNGDVITIRVIRLYKRIMTANLHLSDAPLYGE